MWFAKFFGGRKGKSDDEPARFAPPPSARPVQPVRSAQGKASHAAVKKTQGGFDPYNSGSFDKGNAWERVIRR